MDTSRAPARIFLQGIGPVVGMLLVAVLVAIGVPRADAAPSEADIQACVVGNQARYDSPDRAAVAQYLDLEAACRSGLDPSSDVEVTIAPAAAGADAGSGRPSGGTGTVPGDSSARQAPPAPSPAAPAGGSQGGPEAPGPDASLTEGGSGGAGRPATRPNGAGGGASSGTPSGATGSAQVDVLIAEAQNSGPVPAGVGGLPWPVVAALLAALTVASAGAFQRFRGRRS